MYVGLEQANPLGNGINEASQGFRSAVFRERRLIK